MKKTALAIALATIVSSSPSFSQVTGLMSKSDLDRQQADMYPTQQKASTSIGLTTEQAKEANSSMGAMRDKPQAQATPTATSTGKAKETQKQGGFQLPHPNENMQKAAKNTQTSPPSEQPAAVESQKPRFVAPYPNGTDNENLDFSHHSQIHYSKQGARKDLESEALLDLLESEPMERDSDKLKHSDEMASLVKEASERGAGAKKAQLEAGRLSIPEMRIWVDGLARRASVGKHSLQ